MKKMGRSGIRDYEIMSNFMIESVTKIMKHVFEIFELFHNFKSFIVHHSIKRFKLLSIDSNMKIIYRFGC